MDTFPVQVSVNTNEGKSKTGKSFKFYIPARFVKRHTYPLIPRGAKVAYLHFDPPPSYERDGNIVQDNGCVHHNLNDDIYDNTDRHEVRARLLGPNGPIEIPLTECNTIPKAAKAPRKMRAPRKPRAKV
jgi:hypothetical protein